MNNPGLATAGEPTGRFMTIGLRTLIARLPFATVSRQVDAAARSHTRHCSAAHRLAHCRDKEQRPHAPRAKRRWNVLHLFLPMLQRLEHVPDVDRDPRNRQPRQQFLPVIAKIIGDSTADRRWKILPHLILGLVRTGTLQEQGDQPTEDGYGQPIIYSFHDPIP